MYKGSMRRHLLSISSALLLFASALHAAASPAPPRQIQQFTTDWRFLQSDAAEAESPTFDDSAWKPVTLPHDWSIAGPVEENAPSRAAGGFFPTGIGWYRHTLELTKLDPAKRIFIAFDGIMANSDVYCNGELLGHRPYGYVSFNYDLTPHLHAGKNIIAVRVDDSQQPASRWYPGAGINRQVRLITTSDTHIVPWGTFVTTPDINNSDATIKIRSSILNDSSVTAEVTLAITIDGPGNIHIPSTMGHIAKVIAAHGTADLEESLHIANPDRWDLDHPALYTAHVTLLRNGKPIDNEDVPFGIREFHFDPNQGFFLNGSPPQNLRRSSPHRCRSPRHRRPSRRLGTPPHRPSQTRRQRHPHRPQPARARVPRPRDRMGFLVMDEMFDCWTVAKNPYDYHLYFKEWSIRDTADTVRRDRNHPSIILWSAGNEIHDTPKPDIAIPILKSLVDTFHANDPTRPVTQALFRPNVSHDYDDGLADLLDVVGQNYREQEILKAHADKPTRKIIGTENTHDRNQWVAMRDHPEYSGQFLWSGIDYLGEAGRWPSIGAGSGLLLTTSLPRARAFERQSWWADPKTQPMVRIARRVQAARRGPIDPGYASPTSNNQAATTAPNAPLDPTTRFGQPLLLDWTPKDQSPHTENVEIYTNAEEVELFLNDKSLGTQKLHADASPITFQVPFEPGTLKAVARSSGKVVAAGRTPHRRQTRPPSPHHRPRRSAPDQHPCTRNHTGPHPRLERHRLRTATLVDANNTVIPDNTTRHPLLRHRPRQHHRRRQRQSPRPRPLPGNRPKALRRPRPRHPPRYRVPRQHHPHRNDRRPSARNHHAAHRLIAFIAYRTQLLTPKVAPCGAVVDSSSHLPPQRSRHFLRQQHRRHHSSTPTFTSGSTTPTFPSPATPHHPPKMPPSNNSSNSCTPITSFAPSLIQVIHYRWDNRYLASVLKRYPRTFHGVCRVNPQDPAAPDHLSRLTEVDGFHGVRLSPSASPADDWIRGPLMPPLWRRCAQLKVPMTILAPVTRMPDLVPLIEQNPDLTVVIDHMADCPLDQPDKLNLLLDTRALPKSLRENLPHVVSLRAALPLRRHHPPDQKSLPILRPRAPHVGHRLAHLPQATLLRASRRTIPRPPRLPLARGSQTDPLQNRPAESGPSASPDPDWACYRKDR